MKGTRLTLRTVPTSVSAHMFSVHHTSHDLSAHALGLTLMPLST